MAFASCSKNIVADRPAEKVVTDLDFAQALSPVTDSRRNKLAIRKMKLAALCYGIWMLHSSMLNW